MDGTNFVGLLQEKCSTVQALRPSYREGEVGPDKQFKCSCSVDNNRTTEGSGLNKKSAKQNAAKLMLLKLESEQMFDSPKKCLTNLKTSSITKLYEYSAKEKKVTPLFSEKPRDNELFVTECSFDGYEAVGTGLNRKIAKEMSANLVLKHFNIYDYFENLDKIERRVINLKTPIIQLNELCQNKKLTNLVFKEETSTLDGSKHSVFQVTCIVGDFQTKSSQKLSKRDAKIEAASLMLNILNTKTPASSPSELPQPREDDEESTLLAKRAKVEAASLMLNILNANTPASSPSELPQPREDDEESTPLAKRAKIV